MEQSDIFETYTVSRTDGRDWPAVVAHVRSLVATPEIKVVDIRRDKDMLTIVFRRLNKASPNKEERGE